MKKRNLPIALRWPLYLAVYALLSYLMGSSFREILDNFTDFVIPLLFAAMLSFLINELGYMLFAKLSGYTFASFRIGSYILVNGKQGMYIKRWYVKSVPLQAVMKPPQADGGDYPYRLALWGGVIVNLSLAAIAVAVYFTLLKSSFFEVLVIANLVIVLFDSFPGQSYLHHSFHRKAITNSPVYKRLYWMQYTMLSLLAEDKSLKEMPDAWFDVPQHTEKETEYVNLFRYYRAQRALDRLDVRDADHELSLISTEHSSAYTRGLFGSSILFCKLMLNPRAEDNGQWLTDEVERFHAYAQKYPSVLRTSYAYALLHSGDEEKAKEILARFEDTAKQFPYPRELDGEYNLLRMIDALYRETKPPARQAARA